MALDSLLASLKSGVSEVSEVQPSNGAGLQRYPMKSAEVSEVSGKVSGGGPDTPDTPCNLQRYQRKPALGAGCTPDTPDTPEIIDGEGTAAKVGAADTVKSRCWWIHFADREPVECWSSPPASLAEILENRPDAIAAEPFEPGAAKSPPAHHGGEGAPTPDPDDRRYCTACRNLRGAVCSIARPEAGAMVVANRGYRPDLTRLVRCAGFIEVAP